MLNMSVNKVTTNFNVDESRHFVDNDRDEEDEDRLREGVRHACSETPESRNRQDYRVEQITSYPKIGECDHMKHSAKLRTNVRKLLVNNGRT